MENRTYNSDERTKAQRISDLISRTQEATKGTCKECRNEYTLNNLWTTNAGYICDWCHAGV